MYSRPTGRSCTSGQGRMSDSHVRPRDALLLRLVAPAADDLFAVARAQYRAESRAKRGQLIA
jgi:hypothetical protein